MSLMATLHRKRRPLDSRAISQNRHHHEGHSSSRKEICPLLPLALPQGIRIGGISLSKFMLSSPIRILGSTFTSNDTRHHRGSVSNNLSGKRCIATSVNCKQNNPYLEEWFAAQLFCHNQGWHFNLGIVQNKSYCHKNIWTVRFEK